MTSQNPITETFHTNAKQSASIRDYSTDMAAHTLLQKNAVTPVLVNTKNSVTATVADIGQDEAVASETVKSLVEAPGSGEAR